MNMKAHVVEIVKGSKTLRGRESGKEFMLQEIWVKLDEDPHPRPCDIFVDKEYPAGRYTYTPALAIDRGKMKLADAVLIPVSAPIKP